MPLDRYAKYDTKPLAAYYGGPMPNPDPLLSNADAARILGVTPAAVRLMQKRGELAVAEITTGGIHLYRHTEVNRLASVRAAAKCAHLTTPGAGGRR
jgi:hypothetical protein